jgi:hypothetical protein
MNKEIFMTGGLFLLCVITAFAFGFMFGGLL